MVNTYDITAETAEKIKELKRHEVLLPTDRCYDRLTKLATKLLGVPMAILSFADTDRTWIKSMYGVTAQQISLDLDDIQFYAGVPLINSEGTNLGTLCVLDQQPGRLNEAQQELLKELAEMAVDYMEILLAAKTANAQQKQLLQIAAHDLKNPLTTIPVRADLIKLKKDDPDVVDRMCDQIKQAGLMMTRTIDELLSSASLEAGKISLFTLKLDFAEIVSQLVEANEALAVHKDQHIELYIQSRPFVNADEQRLMEIVDNLINNAVKYSPKGQVITVYVEQWNDKAILKVQDNGPGLTPEDKSRMFQAYSKLSAHPTGTENSTGLGLSIVKQLVEAHHGRVWAESEGQGRGTTFIVEMPCF